MFLRFLSCIIILPLFFTSTLFANEKTIIAEGDLSTGLIENSLTATSVAIATGIDFIELHLAMTSDDNIVLFQDVLLNGITDVARLFPDRNREDGGYYVVDFTLREIQQLRVSNPFTASEYTLSTPIPTLAEELGLIRKLEEHFNKKVNITIEIKHPWFYQEAGKDISAATIDTLKIFNYGTENNTLYIQCFDPEELQRISGTLLPSRQLNIPLIQLIGANDGQETRQLNQNKWEPYNYDWLFTNIGLRMIASYATAIGLPSNSIVDLSGNILLAEYIQDIHQYGLKVFTYSLNNQPNRFPPFAQNFAALLDMYFNQANIDGVYTDTFDDIGQYLKERVEEKKQKETLPTFFSDLELSRPTATKKPMHIETEQ